MFSNQYNWLGKDAVEPLYKLYREVTKGTMNKSGSGGENETLNAWKAYIDELEAKGEQLPVPELNSQEYQDKARSAQENISANSSKVQGNNDNAEIATLEKQSKLAFHELEEHEQLFDSRFKNHGQTAYWIPRKEL